MTQLQAVKAEIERQISEWQALIDKDNATCPITVKTLIYELKNILCFIKSLEKEQDVDLGKELKQWRHEHFKGKRDGYYNGEYLERESQLDLARYIYELGKNGK